MTIMITGKLVGGDDLGVKGGGGEDNDEDGDD